MTFQSLQVDPRFYGVQAKMWFPSVLCNFAPRALIFVTNLS